MQSKLTIIGLTILYLCSGAAYAAPKYHHPQEFLKSIANDPKAGQKVYEHYCALCHAQNARIKLGAPRRGIKSDWAKRMSGGIDGMLKRIDAGMGAMPPRGGCFECSDKLLKAAIVYMLPSKK